MSSIQELDLKKIVSDIIKHHQSINKIYLFGSRAYETNCLSSDIDLLAFSKEDISTALINEWLHNEYPYVDLFLYDESGLATSVSNGSKIRLKREKYATIEEQLDAMLLYENGTFNDSFVNWKQKSLFGFEPPMSIIPDYIEQPHSQINRILAKLDEEGLSPFFTGSSAKEIGLTVINMISKALVKPVKWATKAESFRFDGIKLANEYDFQNFIHLILRPVFPEIEVEPFEIKFDENNKSADFSICKNKIVIEAKWIDSTSKKDAVLKTIDGLKNFYTRNPNIECLVFLILFDSKVEIDIAKIENEYSKEYSNKPILIKLYKNS